MATTHDLLGPVGKRKMVNTPPHGMTPGELEVLSRDEAGIDAYWAACLRAGTLLEQQQWIFAKTMAHNPHHYTLRQKWTTQEDFIWTVEHIRQYGYQQLYGSTWYTCYDVNDKFYWTMGAPINYPNGMACTILINRKPHTLAPEYHEPYDVLSNHVAATLSADEQLALDAALAWVGPLADKTILDVGCGTGRALAQLPLERYLGIDPSSKMLEKLAAAHPRAKTVQTTLRSFVPGPGDLLHSRGPVTVQFDVVLALFGAGSYLTPLERTRLPRLLTKKGKAAVMFYAADVLPQCYLDADRPPRFTRWTPELEAAVGPAERIGDYMLWRLKG